MAFSNLKKRLAVLLAAATAFTFAAPLGITTPVVAEAATEVTNFTTTKSVTVADNGKNTSVANISGAAIAKAITAQGGDRLMISSSDASKFVITDAAANVKTASAAVDSGSVVSGASYICYAENPVAGFEVDNYFAGLTILGKGAGTANLVIAIVDDNGLSSVEQTIPVTVQGSSSLTSTISVNSGGTFTDTAATVPAGANIVLDSGSIVTTSAAIKIVTTGAMSIKTLSAMVADNDTMTSVTVGYRGAGGTNVTANAGAKGPVDGSYCALKQNAVTTDFYADATKPNGQQFTAYVYLATKNAGSNTLTVQINDTKWTVPVVIQDKGHALSASYTNKSTTQTVAYGETGDINVVGGRYNSIVTDAAAGLPIAALTTKSVTTLQGYADFGNNTTFVKDDKGIFLNSKDNKSVKITATSSRSANISYIVTGDATSVGPNNLSGYVSIGNDGTLSVTKATNNTRYGFVIIQGAQSPDEGKTYPASGKIVIPVTLTANSYTEAKILDGESTIAYGVAENTGVNTVSGADKVDTVYLSTDDMKTKQLTISSNLGDAQANYITYESEDTKVFTVAADGTMTAVAPATNEATKNLTITIKNGPDTENTLKFVVPVKVSALKVDNTITDFTNPVYLSKDKKEVSVGGKTSYENQLRYELVNYDPETGKYDNLPAGDVVYKTVGIDGTTGKLTLKDEVNQGVTIVKITGVTNDKAIVPHAAYAYVYYNMSEKTVDSITGADQVSVTVGKTVALDAASTAKSTLSYVSGDTSIATVGTDGVVTGVKAGTTYIKVTANETGITKNVTVVVKALKAVTFKNTSKTFKVATLKKAKKSYSVIKKSGNGKVTYKVTKGTKKYISVSTKGVVTVKKGAKKGTYKVKVTVAAKGDYKKTSKVIKIVVK